MTSEPRPADMAQERCPVCGTEIPPLGVYCPTCGAVKPSMRGRPPPYAPSWMRAGPPQNQSRSVPQVRAVFKLLASFVMLSLIAWILIAFVSMFVGIGIVGPEIQNHQIEDFSLFIAIPYLVSFGSMSGTGLLVYYVMLIAAISASLAWILISSAKGYFKELSMKAKSREHSALFEICALMFATLFLNFVIILATGAADDGVPGTQTDAAELLLILANASVWEEIAVRVLFIGVPLLFIDLVRQKTRKDWYSYLLGGKFKIGIVEVALIVFSAAMFGVAHYLGGWDEWKIPAAGIAGLAFGYLYLKFGIAASITLHFMFDYLSAPDIVFTSVDLTIVIGLLALLWVAVGGVFTVYYVLRIIEFFTGRTFWDEKPQPTAWGVRYQQPYQPPYQVGPYQPGPYQPSYPPPPQVQAPFGGYVCPACGNLEARWVDGRFQCLRCGHLS